MPNGTAHPTPQTAQNGPLLDTSNPAVIWKAIDFSMVRPPSLRIRVRLADLMVVMHVRSDAGARQSW